MVLPDMQLHQAYSRFVRVAASGATKDSSTSVAANYPNQHAISTSQGVDGRVGRGGVTSKILHKPLNRIRQLVECVTMDESTGTLRG